MLTHQLDLLRLSAGEQRKAVVILNRMQGELTVKLQTDLTDYGRARVNRLLKEADKVIEEYYELAAGQTDLSGIAAHETEYTANTMTGIGLQASLPGTAAMKSIVNGALIQGASSAAWWAKQAETTQFNFAAAVRQGIVQGESIQQIVGRVKGMPVQGIAGIMPLTRRNATTLVHESVMGVANDAHMATYRENDDIVKGVQHLSTFDGRTTAICVAYSGAMWDLDGNRIGGTELPWVSNVPGANSNGGCPRHWGCRSTEVPVLKTWRELGVPIDERPVSTRASELGQVRADMTMDEFLKTKTPEQLNGMLGVGRAQLYRDGKITLSQLVSGQGRELTLEQLRKKAA